MLIKDAISVKAEEEHRAYFQAMCWLTILAGEGMHYFPQPRGAYPNPVLKVRDALVRTSIRRERREQAFLARRVGHTLIQGWAERWVYDVQGVFAPATVVAAGHLAYMRRWVAPVKW